MKEFFKLFFSIVSIVVVGFFLKWAWSSDQSADDNKPLTQQDLAVSARGICRIYVKNALNDPASAKWENGATWEVLTDGDKTFVVHPVLRANNGFGALILTKFRCEVYSTGSGWDLIDLREL